MHFGRLVSDVTLLISFRSILSQKAKILERMRAIDAYSTTPGDITWLSKWFIMMRNDRHKRAITEEELGYDKNGGYLGSGLDMLIGY